MVYDTVDYNAAEDTFSWGVSACRFRLRFARLCLFLSQLPPPLDIPVVYPSSVHFHDSDLLPEEFEVLNDAREAGLRGLKL